MDIVIIGDGEVGHKLAMQLSGEKYNVTLIDKSERKLRNAVNETVSYTHLDVYKRQGYDLSDPNSILELAFALRIMKFMK